MLFDILVAIALTATISIFATFFIIRRIYEKKVVWYEAMLDSIPFPLSVTDMKMNWTFINRPVEQLFKKSRKEMVGQQCNNWGAAICKTEKCGIQRLRKDEPVTFFDQFGMNFRVDTAYLTDKNGNKIGHIEVVQDITSLIQVMDYQRQQSEGLCQVLESLAQGRLDRPFQPSAGSNQYTAEAQQLFSRIADAYNTMLDRLRELIQKIKSSTMLIAAHSEEASSISTQMAATVEELHASMQAVEETFTGEIAMAGKATQKANGVGTTMTELQQAAMKISEISDLISDIADQTNLLSLNAAIEAARAGSAGMGFAVVAGEVKKLATKTADSIQSIGGIIRSITTLVDSANEQTRTIGQGITEITASSESIFASVSEQIKTLATIAEASTQTQSSSQELAQMASELQQETLFFNVS